jgi:putative transposase
MSRISAGGLCYHVLNRANGRTTVFAHPEDYAAFLAVLTEACERLPIRLLAYCLMPNHFHFVVWPREDGDLGRWMSWLMTTHVRRYHAHHETEGRLWQGRYKSFPIQDDDHLLTVARYVERNPVRAATLGVSSAAAWPWSSAADPSSVPFPLARPALHPVPVQRRADWLAWVDRPLTADEQEAIHRSIARGSPFGGSDWVAATAGRLGLSHTLQPLGRPRKKGDIPRFHKTP